jgi:asparagine synthase (glutamine-hydrolysing)
VDGHLAARIMSGITGLFHRDRRPAATDAVARMMDVASHRGIATIWSEGSVALGHQLLSDDAPQPCADRTRGRAITFDGRLDNREELIDELKPASGPRASDAALVLAAYEVWGTACAVRLEGDFAFALWDSRTRSIFCARDVLGVKPFYYGLVPTALAFGSELRQVLASRIVDPEPNEGMVAEYLSASIHSQSETLYRGVMRLPAAHLMTVSETGVAIRRYWQLDASRDVVCRNDDEYAERFAEVFRRAVSRRLRGGPAAFFLSGGLDSSSVVVSAAGTGAAIDTFSMVFPGHPALDETRYIDDVVASSRTAAHVISLPVSAPGAARQNIVRRRDVADLPCDGIGETLLGSMRAQGARVALSGHGGDHAFAGTIYHYADLLRAGNYLGFVRQVWADARTPDNGWSIWDPLLCGVRPLLAPSLRAALRPLARRIGLMPDAPDWVDPSLAARVCLDERLRPPALPVGAVSFGRRAALENYASGWLYLVNEMTDCRAAEHGLDERHPFLDRRVVEFAVGIPEAQRWQGRETKFVLRRALGSSLPASVRTRTDKADFTPCVVDGFEALGGASALRRLRIADAGWVSQARVDLLCAEARRMKDRGDNDLSGMLLRLWMIACVDAWYDAVFVKGSQDDRLEEPARRSAVPIRAASQEAGVSAA